MRIAITGLGLIGGSLGEDLRAAYPKAVLVGIDRCAGTVESARAAGLFDVVSGDIKDVFGADVVFVAVDVGAVAEVVAEVYGVIGPAGVITDVGSVKGQLTGLDGLKGIRLVGGHPMAGTEMSGFSARKAGLFRGAAYVLTPYPNTSKADLNSVAGVVRALGARAVVMDAFEHDQLAAKVSHLPHMIAYALSSYAIREGEPWIAGKGFTDMVRTASSDPRFWAEVCALNGGNIRAQIDGMIGELERIKGMLNDTKVLYKYFAGAKEKREAKIK